MHTPSPLEHTAREIVRRLQKAGFEALYAGGCVRDMLRGVIPHDYDIATTARPEEIQSLFRRTLAIGAAFGVINVLENGADFQVATFRCDGAYEDGRHPESVKFSGAEEDAKRRDFTINGLFFDPLKQELRDYVGGREDLAKGCIRAIGDAGQRFAEDRLRMLRAIRFATVLEFEIEPSTWEAIRKHAGAIHEVSAGKELEATVEAVLNHMAFKDVQKMRVARLKRFLARPTMPDELQLHRVDCASSNGDLSNFIFLQNKLEEFSREPLIPPPLVTGRDLIALGHHPGPEFKTLLEEIQSLQLEGNLPDRESALAWLKTHYSPKEGS
ncbi:MAG: CCA tRNA nucleotidyltransferase [Verrucomicrobia bacterium]|nr:CCA tRNA nucleotidyltransferase [Verrucomicrobiota bacterium]